MWFWSGGLCQEAATALSKSLKYDVVFIAFVAFIGADSINPVSPTDFINKER